ncbi:MAG: glycosyltransferase family 4 protein [Phototrophicaceae bacterium]
MHIALNGWFWDQPHVGSGQYVRELLTALRKLDSTLMLTLVLPSHISTAQNVPDGVQVEQVAGGLNGKLGKVWFEQQAFPARVKQIKADLAHVPYWGAPLSSPVKLVVSVLDVIPLLYPEYAGGMGNKAYIALQRAAAGGAAKILTLSEASKRDVVAQLGIPEADVIATPLAPKPAYHPKMGNERDAAVRQKYDLPTEPFILYLGGFDARKRVGQLIEAYRYVVQTRGVDVPLVIAGKEPEWREPLFPSVWGMLHDSDIPADAVRWIGHVDEDDKPSLYRLARVFVYPSAYEGFGLPLLEAMASGTPVVANNIPVFDEIAADGAFLIENGSVTKMAGALLALLEQNDLYESLRNTGIARASNFTWRKTAKQTLDVYKSVLG